MIVGNAVVLGGSFTPINNKLYANILLLTDMGVMTLAVLAYGLVFRKVGYPGWLTWGALVLGVVFIVYQIVFRDMVPMFHYIVTLALGIFLLSKA